jgi:hypothetical protein
MDRPRFIAIISAIVGSTAGFVVLTRWRLIGTVAGAAVVPIVYSLASHFSNASLDRMEKWLRRRRRAGRLDSGETSDTSTGAVLESPSPERKSSTSGEESLSATDEGGVGASARKRGRFGAQWSLAALAVFALAVSVYSLVESSPGERTIVRERIVEKTVTVTTVERVYSFAPASGVDGSVLTGQNDGGAGAPTTDQTATTSEQTDENPDPSSTTTTDPSDGKGADSSSTTVTAPTTTTLP